MKAKLLIYIFFLVGPALALFGWLYLISDSPLYALREKNADTIGAIAESSDQLATVITSIIPDSEDKKYILEVGAGTGIFTEKIIKKLKPHDHLDVVEIMPDLCEVLRKKFQHEILVTIHCIDVLDLKPEFPYSHIISGLPFNSFPAQLIEKISNRYVEFAASNAACSFFEYKWLPSIRPWFMNKEEKDNFKNARDVIENFIRRYEKSHTAVYANIPPATVHFLEINK